MPFFIKTFYDMPAYAAALRWGALRALAYFMFVCALVAASAFITVYNPVKAAYEKNIAAIAGALENVKIKDGKIIPFDGAAIAVNSPEGEPVGIISKTSIDANTAKKLAFSIEGKRLTIYQPNGEISFDLGSVDFGSAENLAQALPTWGMLKWTAIPAVAFAMAVSLMSWHAFMLGTFAFIMDIPHKCLRFGNSLKLAVAASTPAALLGLGYSIASGKMLPEAATMLVSAALVYFAASAAIRQCER